MILVRSLVFHLAFYLWSAFVAIGWTPFLLGPARWTLAMFRLWANGISLLLRVICGIRVEVRGRQHIPTGAALVAPKHQCMLDVFASFAWLPASVYVMKHELARIPWFGWYARKVGSVVIDRAGGSQTLRQMVREAKERFAEGRQLVIFPEGTRTRPGAAADYKPGIAALYREIDVPVHPVATNAGLHWQPLKRVPGTIVYEYLEPIPPGLTGA
ncbi:MAG: lysophospholipid acyltransferase family protein [Phenylobacterium sp.]